MQQKGPKACKTARKILFSINKLSDFAHYEDVRTDSNAMRERDLQWLRQR